MFGEGGGGERILTGYTRSLKKDVTRILELVAYGATRIF
jgi:hypothetical protein